jgi:hypothetical protein
MMVVNARVVYRDGKPVKEYPVFYNTYYVVGDDVYPVVVSMLAGLIITMVSFQVLVE